MKKRLLFSSLFLSLFVRASAAERVQMEFEGQTITIELYDNATAKDFLKKLPMSIYMDNFNNAALYSSLTDSLATDSVAIKTTQKGVLYYYTTTKQLWYNFDVCIYNFPIVEIGKVVDEKKLSVNAYSGGEATFKKVE